MRVEKDIVILNSGLVTYNFDDNRALEVNKVTFAFRSDFASDDIFGFDTIVSCSLDKSTIDITDKIKPFELVKAELGLKKAKDNTFKYVITSINDIEF